MKPLCVSLTILAFLAGLEVPTTALVALRTPPRDMRANNPTIAAGTGGNVWQYTFAQQTPTSTATPIGGLCVMAFNDLDGDGVFQPDRMEYPLAGALISVINLSSVLVVTRTTDASEPLCFFLEPGVYTVTERNPADYPYSSTADVLTRTVVNSSTVDAYFGDRQDPLPTATPTETATPPLKPTHTPTPTTTAMPSCLELVINGGFETTGGWSTTRADRSTSQAHSGQWSMLIAQSVLPGQGSWASARQLVAIPADATRATLTFWYWPVSADASDDVQWVLIYDQGMGNILATVFSTLSNAQTWTPVTFDLSPWIGQGINLYFGVWNDGDGLLTQMYVDDVSVCWRTGTAAQTSTPTRTGTLPTATTTNTPTATLTPTATETPSPKPTATPTGTLLPTGTSTRMPTATSTATSTPTRTRTPTSTLTSTSTPTPAVRYAYLPLIMKLYVIGVPGTPTPTATPWCDPYEPNNDRYTNPWGPLQSAQSYQAKLCIGDAEDNYYFDVGTTNPVQLRLQLPGSLVGNTSIWLYAPGELEHPRCGGWVNTSEYTTTCSIPQPGRYIIRLYTDGVADDVNPYTLRATFQ